MHHSRLLKDIMSDAVKPWSDVIFTTADAKTFVAQFCIISARWPYMLTHVIERRAKESGASSANWKSMHKPTQVESPFSSFIFSIILKYVYSDKVKPEKLKIAEAVDLAVAASQYKLDRLRSIMEHHLLAKLDETTVFAMLKAASERNQLTIKALCLDYASRNFQAFVSNKQGLSLLGIELFQEVTLILSAQQSAAERPAPITLPPTPPSTLTEDFMRLYAQMGLSDAVVMVGGEKLRFHRPVLAVQSPTITRWMEEKRDTIATVRCRCPPHPQAYLTRAGRGTSRSVATQQLQGVPPMVLVRTPRSALIDRLIRSHCLF